MAGKSRFGLLLILLVCGCFQRFFPIRAIETEDGVAFELPELADGLSHQRSYALLDLMVTSPGCGSQCTVWDIVSAPGSHHAHLKGARVAYGEAISGTVIRTAARALTPGMYTVGATVQEYGPDAELVRSLSTLGDFEVYRESSGKLRVRSHGGSGKKGGCR